MKDVRSFWIELRRRRVVRNVGAYVVGALTVGGAAQLYGEAFGAADWVLRTILGLLVVGLPLAAAMSWAYDITPEGIERAGPSESGSLESGIATARNRKSIVVLPFDNMSPDPNDAYFSDGLTEEIRAQLSYLRSLRVISRNTAIALKNTQKDVRTIGRELDVEYVLEGSVRKAGDSLRITAQLIDAGRDEHLWAETYARELRDVFETQSDIALGVAAALETSLDPREKERISSPATQSLDAHDAYLLGWHHIWGGTEDGFRKARGYFSRTLELDPDYALAHAGLAWWYVWAGGAGFSVLPTAEAIPKAKAEAERANELDPDLGEPYATLAGIESEYCRWASAERTARLGVQRDPNSTTVWMIYALVLGVTGRHEECLAAVDRAVELEPLGMMALNHAALHYCNAGRLSEALAYAKRSEEVDTGFWGAAQIALVLQCRGEDDDAMAHLLLIPEHWETLQRSPYGGVLAYAFAKTGRCAEFEDALADLEQQASAGAKSWASVAMAVMGVGDHERALDCLERAPDQPVPGSEFSKFVGVLPYFAPIRDKPRFQQVLKRLGLE